MTKGNDGFYIASLVLNGIGVALVALTFVFAFCNDNWALLLLYLICFPVLALILHATGIGLCLVHSLKDRSVTSLRTASRIVSFLSLAFVLLDILCLVFFLLGGILA